MKTSRLWLACAMLASGFGGTLLAQAPSFQTIATSLQRPAKIIQSPLRNYIVAEVGTVANTSRISIIDSDGNRRTLVSGLPCAVSAANTLSGVSGLYMRGRTLFTTIGEGNPTLPGPVPRTEVVNPNPASPLFSCVLAITFNAKAEKQTTGINLTTADHQELKDGHRLVREDSDGRKITIDLVTDFPDYILEPVPALATNVRHSQPYGIVADDDYLYVVDGGLNRVHKVDIVSGAFETLVSFPNIANPLFPTLGGPTVEVVPTSITWIGDRLAVTLLSGFPFPGGTSQVTSIDPTTGSRTPLITGLTSAIAVLPLTEDDQLTGYLALEYSLAHLNPAATGRLQLFNAAGTSPIVLAAGPGFLTPASMVHDRKAGEVVIGLINVGTLVSVPVP